MATVREWADAYLAQARADLEAVQLLGGRAPSVTAMLLQMTFEKFGKAALLRSSAVSLEWAKTTHAAASRMLLVMQRQRGILAPMGGPQVWQDVLWTVATLSVPTRNLPAADLSSSTRGKHPRALSTGQLAISR